MVIRPAAGKSPRACSGGRARANPSGYLSEFVAASFEVVTKALQQKKSVAIASPLAMPLLVAGPSEASCPPLRPLVAPLKGQTQKKARAAQALVTPSQDAAVELLDDAPRNRQ